MEYACIAFFVVWVGVLAFVLFRLLTRGFRGAALRARVVHEQLALRAASSDMVKSDISVVLTDHEQAPIGIAVVQRAPLSVSGHGICLTPEQALTVAAWLRQAAG